MEPSNENCKHLVYKVKNTSTETSTFLNFQKENDFDINPLKEYILYTRIRSHTTLHLVHPEISVTLAANIIEYPSIFKEGNKTPYQGQKVQ